MLLLMELLGGYFIMVTYKEHSHKNKYEVLKKENENKGAKIFFTIKKKNATMKTTIQCKRKHGTYDR